MFFQWCRSRDGSKIAYIDQSQLIVYSKDSRRSPLQTQAICAFHTDGKRIAYIECSNREMPDELKNRFGGVSLKYATQFQRLKVMELASKEIYIVGGDLYSFDWSYDTKHHICGYDQRERASLCSNIAEGSERLVIDSGDGSGSYCKALESSPAASLSDY